MKRSFYFLFLLLPVMMISCQKEISLETGSLPGDSTVVPPTTTGNCKIAKFIESDQVTGKTMYAYIGTFDSNNRLATLEDVDSSNGVIFSSFALTYPTGRIQLDPQQYFVTGSDGKVTEFHGYEDPENRLGSKLVARFTYNSSGQLTLRTVTFDSIPNNPTYQFKFTWTGGNLVKEDIEYFYQGTFVRFGTVDYSYDASKKVKGFLNMFGFCSELIVFQSGINTGTGNVNAVTKIVHSNINPLAGNTATVAGTTTITNYIVDSNGYVQSFNVNGDDFYAVGIIGTMKYRLVYHCF